MYNLGSDPIMGQLCLQTMLCQHCRDFHKGDTSRQHYTLHQHGAGADEGRHAYPTLPNIAILHFTLFKGLHQTNAGQSDVSPTLSQSVLQHWYNTGSLCSRGTHAKLRTTAMQPGLNNEWNFLKLFCTQV